MLLVGSGAREHALAWSLVRSSSLTELHAAPGNPGIAALGSCHPTRADDHEGLLDLALTLSIDLVVVGPEAPLVAGLADALRRSRPRGLRARARRPPAIEGSKSFAKEVLAAAGVPTASPIARATAPCVIKADGLAAGKGVFVCRSDDESTRRPSSRPGTRRLGRHRGAARGTGGLSLCALRTGDGPFRSAPPRTSSAPATATPARTPAAWARYSRRAPWLSVAELVEEIHQPVLDELARRGTPFVGCLFAGLMITDRRPARARVQRALRRPRDAGAAAARSTAISLLRSAAAAAADSATRRCGAGRRRRRRRS